MAAPSCRTLPVSSRLLLLTGCLLCALACDAARESQAPAPSSAASASASAHADEARGESARPASAAPPAVAAATMAGARAEFVPPDDSGWGRAGELRYLEVVKGGGAADQPLPMVVMIHGLGDRPRDVWVQRAGVPMRVIMPQAHIPHHGGFSWFPYRVGDNDAAALARGVAAAADKLARALALLAAHRPTLGRPIVGGFSQGGMLSYALALGHPEVLGAALPVSGMLPRPLWPSAAPGPRAVPIRALHGDADEIVPIAPARALLTHLEGLGYDAELTEYPGVAHRMVAPMAARLGAEIDRFAREVPGATQSL